MPNRPTILLVDDRIENIETLKELFKVLDVNCVLATSGDEALKKTLENDFALALVDVQMPDMDGFETVELMRQQKKTAHLPILFLSGIYSDSYYQIKGIETGAVDFITKPVAPEILIGKIQVHLDLYRHKASLQEAHDKLEVLVKERTAKLVATNEQLQAEIIERKNAEEEIKKAKEEIEAWNSELEQRVREKTDELIQSQAQLIQSEKLSAMGKMAAGLAHELNSPLAGLLPMIQKFRDNAENNSEAYTELSLMLKACNFMARIVKVFGDFSRQSKGIIVPLNLNELIEDTLSFSATKLRQKGIRIVKEYEDNLPDIQGDKTELQQVVLNMITNALDALSEGGELIIRTRASKDNSVTMEFIDNGEGIREENIKKIFDPFFTTKSPGKGIGLGLSVSYKIIEKHGGQILVESRMGEGTTFIISLPAAS